MKFRFSSIRWTIFLLYTLILLVTFSIFSGFIYFYSRHEAYNKVDALLDVRARGVEDSIRTYLKTRSIKIIPQSWDWLFSRMKDKEEDSFPSIALFLTETRLMDPEDRMRISIDIFESDGNLIASSSSPPRIAALSAADLRYAAQGNRRYFTYSVPVSGNPGQTAKTRVLLRPLVENGQLLYLIQTRTSLQSIEAQLSGIFRFLAVLVLVTLFVASWAGVFLVTITLLPVNKMIKKIQDIRAEDLSDRLSIPGTKDEISDLADTFNEMLARVEKAFLTQKQTLQDLSHELKTPLTVMRGQIGVILKKPRTDAEYRALLESNLEEIAKMRKIIEDLLMLARLDSRAATLETREIDLGAVVRSAMDDTRLLAEEKGITTSFEGSSKFLIDAHDGHLKRLFFNLLDNAVKYTPSGGRINISLLPAKGGEGASVKVQDTGIGIQADQIPHIFDRFYRAENGRRSGSYGLGLNIVKSIVEAHKGEIHLESEPGKGTTFRVYLQKRPPLPLF